MRSERLTNATLFLASCFWYFGAGALATSATRGLSLQFGLAGLSLVLQAAMHLFLFVLGFSAVVTVSRRSAPAREIVALPRRESAAWELWFGVAVGWGTVALAVVPLVLFARMSLKVNWAWEAVESTLLTLVAVALTALTQEIAFRGYPFRALIGALGTTPAVMLVMAGAGWMAWRNPLVSRSAVVGAMLLALLLSLGWLRTWGIWVSWGLHFGLTASLGVLFGLRVGGVSMPSIVHARVAGAEWLTGGVYGPEAALLSLVLLLGAVYVVVRGTGNLAWRYTHVPIVPGGYPMEVAPPAAHVAMEHAAVAPGLVQILPSTPQSFSAGGGLGGGAASTVSDRIH